MISLLIWLLPPLGNAALASGYRMLNAVWSAVGYAIGREAEPSFEAVCLFSLLGITLTLAFYRMVPG